MTMPIVSFGRHILNQIETGITKEWFQTNGLGSYAMGTIVGANTRRYHGLFVTAKNQALHRSVLVNRVEESLLIHGRRVDCSCQEYPGTVSPQGHLTLESFTYDPFPRWVISVDDVKIEKQFFMRQGEETAVLIYKHLVGPAVKLLLRPFFSCRDHHTLIKEDDRFKNAISFQEHVITCAVAGQPEFFTKVVGESGSLKENIKIYPEGYWYRNLLYAHEEEGELDYQEDLFSPAIVLTEISAGQKIALIFTREKDQHIDLGRWLEQELFVRNEFLEKSPMKSAFAKRCAIAADQFVIRTSLGPRIVSGYPWQEDSIRETLMSLPGLLLVFENYEEARAILRDCSKLVIGGLLPHRFYCNGDKPNLQLPSMDSPLWFIWACQKYWEATKDIAFLKEMKNPMEQIVRAYKEGIRIPDPSMQLEIYMDQDGLIWGSATTPLTWMNGKIADWLATPRKGKPVEIQALWYNALQFLSELCLKLNENDPAYAELAKKARASFNSLFWNPQNNYMYDVIDGNRREGSIRPNALYAMSLPYEILDNEKFKPALDTAWRNLYTSLGLRTLSPNEPHFHGNFKGDHRDKISAAHNGTVLTFLFGSFLTAYFKAYGRDQKNKEEAIQFLSPFISHLADAGLGTISEMFDGNSPHNPRGCIAEARSVAEILRVMKEEGLEL